MDTKERKDIEGWIYGAVIIIGLIILTCLIRLCMKYEREEVVQQTGIYCLDEDNYVIHKQDCVLATKDMSYTDYVSFVTLHNAGYNNCAKCFNER